MTTAMKNELDSAMEKCEQLGELLRIIKEGGGNTPRLLYDLAAEKCNEISQLLMKRPAEDCCTGSMPGVPDPATEESEQDSQAAGCNTPCHADTAAIPETEEVCPASEEAAPIPVREKEEAEEGISPDTVASLKDETPDSGENGDGICRPEPESDADMTGALFTGECGQDSENARVTADDDKTGKDTEGTGLPPETGFADVCIHTSAASETVCTSNSKHGSIKSLLSINDLYLFKRELFNDDSREMNSLFDKLEKADTLDECRRVLGGFIDFEPEDGSTAADFFERLKNRF